MSSKEGDFEAVKRDLAKVIPQPDYDDGSAGPILVRLAWHASGTYDKNTGKGGSNGAGMRWEAEGGDPANAGLQHARVFLEPVKKKHPWISYSDLWTLAGVVAIKEMGGPEIPWEGGRTDFDNENFCPPRGLLPDATKASDHLRDVFGRMGFNDQEIVALSGAHSLGRCHTVNSGFEGPWTVSPTKFSATYYRMLLKFKWEKKELEGLLEDGKRMWQYRNDDLGEELMMLPTDYALVEDEKFRPYVEMYADDRDKFFEDFSAVFAKLIELGVDRSKKYETAPKKSDEMGAPGKGDGLGHKNGPGKAKL